MTISKKLMFMIACVFGTQATLPWFDAAVLKTEVAQVIDFVDQLFKHNTREARNAAEWLTKQMHKNNGNSMDNADVIEIARTITANSITMDAKIAAINKKMAERAEAKVANQKKWIKILRKWSTENAMVAFAGGIMLTMCGVALYNDTARMIAFRIEQHDSDLSRNIMDMVFKQLQAQKDQTQI